MTNPKAGENLPEQKVPDYIIEKHQAFNTKTGRHTKKQECLARFVGKS